MDCPALSATGGPLDGAQVFLLSSNDGGRIVVDLVAIGGMWWQAQPGHGQSSAIYRRQGDRLVYAPPRRVEKALAAR